MPASLNQRTDPVTVAIREHLALAALIAGSATHTDLHDLEVAASLAQRLQRTHNDRATVAMFAAADRVLIGVRDQLHRRPLAVVAGPGAGVLRWLLKHRDEQRAAATAAECLQALALSGCGQGGLDGHVQQGLVRLVDATTHVPARTESQRALPTTCARRIRRRVKGPCLHDQP